MLASSDLIAFAATRDPARAKGFYRDTLGLKLVEESPFAVVFDANGTMLRIQTVGELIPAPYTALGWRVDDIRAAIDSLMAKGVRFERYDGFSQDERAIWCSPSGAEVAWFKDPDGNTLSLTQWPSEAS